MIPFDTALAASLGTRRAVRRMLLRFDLGSGVYGFHSGAGPFGPYEGITYVGSGQLLRVEGQSGGLDAAVSPITVTLSSMPNSQLTPDVLATIFSEQWHQKPAVLSRAYFHPDTRALLAVRRASRRVIDTITMRDSEDGGATLVVSLEPVVFDNPRRGWSKFGDSDQRMIDPNDAFFSFAATAGTQTIEWGRAPQGADSALSTTRSGR
jgi:hypothetical protein